jgi:UPF0755 protein
LYGEIGYAGQHAPEGQDPNPYDPQDPLGQSPYEAQFPYDAQAQYYPQQAPQQPQEYDAWGTGQQPLPGHPPPVGHPGRAYPDPSGQGRQPDPGRPPMDGQQPRYPDQWQGQGRDPSYGGQYDDWDTGQHGQTPYGAGADDPYGRQPRAHHNDEAGSGGAPGPTGAPGPSAPDFAAPGEAGAYSQPGKPTARRRPRPVPEPDPPIDWDPGPDQGEHAFFAGSGDDDDDDLNELNGRRGRGERRGRGGKGRKRRSGCACFVVAVVAVGAVGGVGYLGFTFYENHFGAPPDFAGTGLGQTVSIEIPKGAGGYTIGQLLKDKGVVKSVDAFVHAQQDNPKGQTIQDGVYTLHKQMSGKSVVALLLDPKSRNNLIIAEGRRNAWVYAQIDTRLGLKPGTTNDLVKKDWKKLGLPAWAMNHRNVKDPLEGFLYPSSYPVAKGMKPEDILKKMVATATGKYDSLDIQAQADKLHLDGPWQVITVASLVQAEGKTHDDFRKMSEVVYNRLKPSNTQTNQLLQFDSTFNYLKGQSNIDISETEINSNRDPYNTYTQKGLPPGPIGNPGADALAAAVNPTHEGWFYFVATDGMNKTEFAKTYAEFQQLKEKFNASGHN